MQKAGVARNAGTLGNPLDEEDGSHLSRNNAEVSGIRRPAKTGNRLSAQQTMGPQLPIPTPEKATARTARRADRGMPVFAKPANPPARIAPSRSKAAAALRKAATPSKRTPVQGAPPIANQEMATSTKTSAETSKRPELPIEWRHLSPDVIATKLDCERTYTRAAAANDQKTRLTEDDIRYLRQNLRENPAKRRQRVIPERPLSPSDWRQYLEEQADRIKLEQQAQEVSAPATNLTPRNTSDTTATEKTGSSRKRRQTVVPWPPLLLSDVAEQHQEEAETMGFMGNAEQASVPSANHRTLGIAPNSVLTQRIVSHAAATPSRIPRPDCARAKGTSPLPGGSPIVHDSALSRSTIRPMPQQILFPRMAPANDSPSSKQTPARNTAIMSPTGTQGRPRQISTASDIDDKLRQSMLRMPRVSGLSNTSPLSVFNSDSPASPVTIGRRTLKQSSLADTTLSTQFSEVSALSPTADSFRQGTPRGPRERARQPAAQSVPTTPLRSAYAKLQQINKDLEEEKMSMEFDLWQVHEQAVDDLAKRRDEEVARRWREVASACQAELALLKREKAQRKREMDTFDKMVTLAKLVV